MSTQEVCAALNISHDTLRRLRDRGDIKELPGNPMLRKEALRFRPEDVERLKENPPRVEAS